MYLAHIADGRSQTVKEHLVGTAKLARQFASEFGAEDIGELAALSHDIGKYSVEFQRRIAGGPVVDHSTAGAMECLKLNQIHAALAVAGHHCGLLDVGNTGDTPLSHTFFGRKAKYIVGDVPNYSFWEKEISLPENPQLPSFIKNRVSPLTDAFFSRMLYSCLVDADYLDTEEFMTNGRRKRLESISLEDLNKRLSRHTSAFFPPKSLVNKIRCEVLQSCLKAGRGKKGLYNLTVPTGGAKTLSSLAFALQHAVVNKMDRVIYVIPYTSVIDQTAEIFKTILGEESVIEHHSSVVWEGTDDIESVGYKKALAAENWDAPIIVTTAVQFFESLYSNKPSKCRKLHNIANSVIIFDEAQTIPVDHLEPCVYAISQLVQNYGASAVMCTATQPALNDLFCKYTNGMEPTEIVSNPSTLYQQLKRVTFDIREKMTKKDLAAEIASYSQVLCIVNNRIAARNLYTAFPEEGTYHLSTFMYPVHRRKVIKEIKNRLKEGLPCRVISTSLIEAGVDLDFPRVFREIAGLDSIIQAAGRCNRNGVFSPEDSIVTVFEGDWERPEMMGPPVGACKEVLKAFGSDIDNADAIYKYFQCLRSYVRNDLDKCHVLRDLDNGIDGCLFPFETVSKNFHYIESSTMTVFIPSGGGKEVVNKILRGEISKEIMRKAGQYSVSVYEKQFNELLESGSATKIGDDSAVLTDLSLYSNATGLCA